MNIKRQGISYQTKGEFPIVGQQAPEFSLTNTKDDVITLQSLAGMPVMMSVVPNINTRICDLQTRAFHTQMAQLPEVRLVTISKNTKEEFLSWCAANDVDMEMLSDSAFTFGEAYGIYVPELEVNQRSVFVLDETGRLVYQEILEEMVEEPNYAQAIEVAKKLVK